MKWKLSVATSGKLLLLHLLQRSVAECIETIAVELGWVFHVELRNDYFLQIYIQVSDYRQFQDHIKARKVLQYGVITTRNF